MERFETVGMVARWRPVHLGHAAVLDGLCGAAERVILGIGSANRYDHRNPFTVEETRAMIRAVLPDRRAVTIVSVPDLGDGPRWRELVAREFGGLDLFVTANPHVADLMGAVYPIRHPTRFVPPEKKIAVDGSMVRRTLAQGGDWAALVPPEVARILRTRRLDERFREEFGLRTLAEEIDWRQNVLVG